MKKPICSFMAAAAALLLLASPGQAYRGGGGGAGLGALFGLGIGIGIMELAHPYNSPSYYPPPVVVQQAPVIYMQQAPQPVPAQPAYWYYCQDPQGYYPYVNQCPRGWMRVVPAPPGPN